MSAAYATLSTSHLRHWAKAKDPAAQKLYPLKARGSAVLLTIELLRAITLAIAIALLSNSFSAWFMALLLTVIFFFAFVVLTQLFLKPFGMRLLIWLSGPLLFVTHMLKFATLPLGRVFDHFIDNEPATITRHDLAKTLMSVSPEDTDLTTDEVRILTKVLDFSKRTVHEVMIPKSKVVTVKVDEALSPVMLDELHKTGHARFPVMSEDNTSIVGTLTMHDLADLKHSSSVADVMQSKVYFVEEDRTLDHVLDTFYKTRQSVFVVLNMASDMVGLISIEDVLEQILGKPDDTDSAKKLASEKIAENSAHVVK
jgi:CBS domain containing-hemolysin-like protein